MEKGRGADFSLTVPSILSVATLVEFGADASRVDHFHFFPLAHVSFNICFFGILSFGDCLANRKVLVLKICEMFDEEQPECLGQLWDVHTEGLECPLSLTCRWEIPL